MASSNNKFHRPSRRHSTSRIDRNFYELSGQRQEFDGMQTPTEAVVQYIADTATGSRRKGVSVSISSQPRHILAERAALAAKRAEQARENGVKFLPAEIVATGRPTEVYVQTIDTPPLVEVVAPQPSQTVEQPIITQPDGDRQLVFA